MSKNKDVIIVKPNKKPELDKNQIEYIQKVLEKSCIDHVCISKAKLYSELKDVINLDIEQSAFEKWLTDAIKNGQLNGFESRVGKYGGICKKGAFDKNKICTIELADGTIYETKTKESEVVWFILNTLDGKLSSTGTIKINKLSYNVSEKVNSFELFDTFLLDFCNAKKIKIAGDKSA